MMVTTDEAIAGLESALDQRLAEERRKVWIEAADEIELMLPMIGHAGTANIMKSFAAIFRAKAEE
ncbi:hypothetical protein HBA54_04070 [Pelagibius litoralis]|uniref:Uncharacterized protein n=1 Tax=Pelagibius litoralis TaxID=374515 RepID=A0A967EWQ0_9PROT|nr:hypothetical protein [Pelagibius litoralis]NIA67758.1 hypothetical protein [Pelagibius litoralis]